MLLGEDTQFLPCHFQVLDFDAAPYPANHVALTIFLRSVKPAVPAVFSVYGAPGSHFSDLSGNSDFHGRTLFARLRLNPVFLGIVQPPSGIIEPAEISNRWAEMLTVARPELDEPHRKGNGAPRATEAAAMETDISNVATKSRQSLSALARATTRYFEALPHDREQARVEYELAITVFNESCNGAVACQALVESAPSQ